MILSSASAGQLVMRREISQDTVWAYGFPRWKHKYVRRCLAGHDVQFLPLQAVVPSNGRVLLWGMMPPPDGCTQPILRMEDGFLRSVGLGADLVRPLSWVIDQTGLYYDATRPSDLETLLATTEFSADLCWRAASLRERILTLGLTKYTLPGKNWRRPATQRHVSLVVGQVESDASLAFGAPGIRTNLGLLQAVRAAYPDSYLVYKPHPDVVARLRAVGQGEDEARAWCDEIVTDAPMASLLEQVDNVQVITSLAGFEALLRGRRVTCYGLPFYAGWGLTEDKLSCPRRGRSLSLDALIAASLMLYPRYFSHTGIMDPETAITSLAAWKKREAGRIHPFRGIYRFFLRRIAGVR